MNYQPGSGAEYVRITGASKRYGDTVALHPVHLTIKEGECVTLLGPSGSGKTTLLKLLAGFENPTSGEIYVGGRNLTRLPPAQRGIGMVFQQYALFPHMNVLDNVAYGLKMRRVGRADRYRKARQTLETVRLSGFETRFPYQLSGGQQQRVALARALAFDPTLILMDEPLGALDRALRLHMEEEIRTIQRSSGVTMIYVTHDQEEALTLSDRIVLLREGRVVTQGQPEKLYAEPETAFTADFLGGCNLLDLPITEKAPGVGVVSLTDEQVEVPIAGQLPERPLLCFRTRAFRDVKRQSKIIDLKLQIREILYLGDDVQVTGSVMGSPAHIVRARVDPVWAQTLRVGTVSAFPLPFEAIRIVPDDR